MFIAKKHVSRRTVLRGMGVTLALPLLDSMVPAQTPSRKTIATPRTRLACIEMVHGAAGTTGEGATKHYRSPQRAGSDFEFSYSLEPLAPFSQYITIVSGTDAQPAEAQAPSEGAPITSGRARCSSQAAHAKQTDGSDISTGISIDLRCMLSGFGDTAPRTMRVCHPSGFASRTSG